MRGHSLKSFTTFHMERFYLPSNTVSSLRYALEYLAGPYFLRQGAASRMAAVLMPHSGETPLQVGRRRF